MFTFTSTFFVCLVLTYLVPASGSIADVFLIKKVEAFSLFWDSLRMQCFFIPGVFLMEIFTRENWSLYDSFERTAQLYKFMIDNCETGMIVIDNQSKILHANKSILRIIES